MSRKAAWNRIQADIYGVPVVTLENPQATLAGAAVLAACGAGVFRSPREAVRRMVRPAGRFEPDPAGRAAWAGRRRRYRDVRESLRAAGVWTTLDQGA